ncbi:hypothetical protein A2U01_0038203, partial [Trifolium medium]|nr:hypothetical protein [Trifolium medium]
AMNDACLMKIGWELQRGNNALWCQVMRGKYESGSLSRDAVEVKANDSAPSTEMGRDHWLWPGNG